MPRLRTYEAEDIARSLRETFTANAKMREHKFTFDWPSELQNVGDSLAVAYSSDKWQDDGSMILYKHLAESRNKAYCIPGFLRDYNDPSKPWPTIGPMVTFERVPMPKHFAILALFEEANLHLHTSGTDERPRLGRGDEGVVKVTVAHGMLGASKFCWSHVSEEEDEPFLFVYTKKEGVLMVITGEELDVHKEGIVG